MPRRRVLSERQRSALFDIPVNPLALVRHYTLTDDDFEHIKIRRRAENKLGFALQLCALRYPGRSLVPGEIIPELLLRHIGAQLGISGQALLDYAVRRQTRHS